MRAVVVGAGIIGRAVAWRLAQRRVRVVLVDPDPSRAAAQVAAGMLAPVTEIHYGEEALLGLNLASARRWPSFAAELGREVGADPGFVECGTLAVARDGDDMTELHSTTSPATSTNSDFTSSDCRAGRSAGMNRPWGPAHEGACGSPAITRSTRARRSPPWPSLARSSASRSSRPGPSLWDPTASSSTTAGSCGPTQSVRG
ncbi:MAG: FAD-dependent oxidoreductase [Acidimicrobiales bacterium]|nr:FAD-dependent oxidoreductase [Acidimicrobiales bacterium]